MGRRRWGAGRIVGTVRTAVSHHIKLLEQAGFIEISKDATRRICSVRADRWLPLLDELSSALKADLAAAEQCRA